MERPMEQWNHYSENMGISWDFMGFNGVSMGHLP